jgi:antitoxin PrlF
MSHIQIFVAPNGRVVIPADMRAAVGVKNGGSLLAHLRDGVIVLEPVDAAVLRAQAMVGRYVNDGPSLVTELIAERHAAAENE